MGRNLQSLEVYSPFSYLSTGTIFHASYTNNNRRQLHDYDGLDPTGIEANEDEPTLDYNMSDIKMSEVVGTSECLTRQKPDGFAIPKALNGDMEMRDAHGNVFMPSSIW
jgi:hypothetical protein